MILKKKGKINSIWSFHSSHSSPLSPFILIFQTVTCEIGVGESGNKRGGKSKYF